MGPGKPIGSNFSIHSSSGKPASRFIQYEFSIQQGVVFEPPYLFNPEMGSPRNRLSSKSVNSKCSRFLSRARYPLVEGIDCLHHPWRFSLGYRFPPIPLIPRSFGRAQEGLEHSHDGISIFAAKAIVCHVAATRCGRYNSSCSYPEPSFLGAVSAPNSGEPAPDGLETERERFTESYCSNQVVTTLLQPGNAS